MLGYFIRRPLGIVLLKAKSHVIFKSPALIGRIVSLSTNTDAICTKLDLLKKMTDSSSLKETAKRVRNLIDTHAIMIFSKSYCPFCKKVKKLFGEELNVPYHAIELDHDPHGSDIQDHLKELTGQKTVPNVFVNGQHIGGCDATYAAYYQGQFKYLASNAATATIAAPSSLLLSSNNPQETHDKKDTDYGIVAATTTITYDYDLIVIGGGSGGIACAREGNY